MSATVEAQDIGRGCTEPVLYYPDVSVQDVEQSEEKSVELINSSMQAFASFTENYLLDLIKDPESLPDDLIVQLNDLYNKSATSDHVQSIIKACIDTNSTAPKELETMLYRDAVGKMNMSRVYKFNHPRILVKIMESDLCGIVQYTNILKLFAIAKRTNYKDSHKVINQFMIACNAYFIIKQMKSRFEAYDPVEAIKPLIEKLDRIFA